MSKIQKYLADLGSTELIIISFTFILLVLAGYFMLRNTASPVLSASSSNNKSVSTSTTSDNQESYAVLSPATVPSKVPECSQALTYASDGDSSPVECANGDLNIQEWNSLSALEPEVMTLGYTPSFSQVQAALCKDASDSDSDANTKASNIIEATTYQISALYCGWSFSSDPSVVLTNGTC
jgi:hypothetical protein